MGRGKLVDMCNGPLQPAILRYAFPSMVSSTLMLAFHAADLVVIGRWGSANSLAAVGAVGALIHLIVVMFFGVTAGVDVVVARLYGANKAEKLHVASQTAMAYSFWGGVFMAILGFLIADWAVTLLRVPPEIFPKAVEYVRIYFISIPFIAVFSFGCSVIRAVGDTRHPMAYLIVAGVLNFILNILFVLPMKMDVAGVAWATTISQAVAAYLMVKLMVREKGAWHLDLNHLRINFRMLMELLKQGIPSGVSGACFSISNVAIQASVNYFGAMAMAGSAAAASWESVVYIASACFGQAVTCFVSQNYGAKKLRRMLLSTKYCLIYSAGCTLGMGILACIFVNELMHVFSSDPDVVSWGRMRCFLMFPTYFICGIFETLNGSLRGIGKATTAAVVTMLGICVVRLIWVWGIFPLHRSMSVLFLCYPVSWIITALFTFYFLYREYPSLKARLGLSAD